MLNVSVLLAETTVAVTAIVTVKTVNLTGQLKNVTMRKIEEGEAIYTSVKRRWRIRNPNF